jgi:hypothetical protein
MHTVHNALECIYNEYALVWGKIQYLLNYALNDLTLCLCMLRYPAKPQICQQVQALGQEILDMQDVTLKLETKCS